MSTGPLEEEEQEETQGRASKRKYHTPEGVN